MPGTEQGVEERLKTQFQHTKSFLLVPSHIQINNKAAMLPFLSLITLQQVKQQKTMLLDNQ